MHVWPGHYQDYIINTMQPFTIVIESREIKYGEFGGMHRKDICWMSVLESKGKSRRLPVLQFLAALCR